MAMRSPFSFVIFNLRIVSHEAVRHVSITSRNRKHQGRDSDSKARSPLV